MKIIKGKFPWALLNLSLLGVFGLWVASWSFFKDPSVGPGFWYSAAAFVAWFIFLCLKSGAAPSQNGNEALQAAQPKTFWSNVTGWVLVGCFFLLVASK
jgi:hypothetical protein